MNSYGDIVKKILMVIEPKVYYFYHKYHKKFIIMDSLNLEVIRNRKKEIQRFINPTWDSNSSEKTKVMELEEIK